MKVLITGAGGQIGRELVRQRPARAQVLALNRAELDIGDANAVRDLVADFAPTVIVNAAGYTAVDIAEHEPDAAMHANAIGPRLLALAARDMSQCRLIHISSDYVFDGSTGRARQPSDPPNPLNVYGRSKLAGEQAAIEVLGGRTAVLRTSWVYGSHGRTFLHTMLRLMRAEGVVRVVVDQIGTPTSTPALAAVLWEFTKRPDLSGVHHWSDAGVASWYDFAVAIAEEAAALGVLPAGVAVTPVSTEEQSTRATRPAFAVLDTRATAQAIGLTPRHWRFRLREVLGSMSGG